MKRTNYCLNNNEAGSHSGNQRLEAKTDYRLIIGRYLKPNHVRMERLSQPKDEDRT